jgi:hypothetical protein
MNWEASGILSDRIVHVVYIHGSTNFNWMSRCVQSRVILVVGCWTGPVINAHEPHISPCMVIESGRCPSRRTVNAHSMPKLPRMGRETPVHNNSVMALMLTIFAAPLIITPSSYHVALKP